MPSATRITNLDFIRGVALLGILVINVISFGLPITALFNHSTYGAENLLDWIVIVISSVFFEYKMMGLFSMLFGVGLMIFLDNAKQKVKRPKLLSFWRNFLLLLFGIAHLSIWEGDILITYASCAFLIILFPQIKNNKITIFFITLLKKSTSESLIATNPFNRGLFKLPFRIILRFTSPSLKVKYSSAKISINSISFPFPINLRSKLSDLFIGIEPSILIGISESFIRMEKSISKLELSNSTSPWFNIIELFLIYELLEVISLEKDFVSRS